MPAPKFLSGLPKPILFGLYGAVGGLLGALVFGEPAWQILRPPPPPKAAAPEPQIAVAASKDLQLLLDKENSFPVEIARDGFDGPVEVKVENLPVGVTAAPIAIAKGQTTGRATVKVSGSATVATTRVKVIASGSTDGKTVTAEAFIEFQVSAQPPPQADVFFVLDVTGSMTWAINGVRDGIGGFAAKMKENKIDYRIGLLAFRDLTIDPVPMDLLKFKGEPFTTDVDDFRKQVGRLVSMGGGDEPESSLEAVKLACEQPFRKGATKVLLLITDAPPKVKPGQNIPQSADEELAGAQKTAEEVKAKEIDAVHLVVRQADRATFTPLMEAGLSKGVGVGKFFDLEVVGKGRGGFDTILNDFSSAITEAAAAKNPVKPQVAAQAEKPVLGVKGVQSSQEFAKGTEGQLVLAIGVWTGAISGLVCLILLSGQHHYLRGSLPAPGGAAAGFAGGLVVGIVGGVAGQGLYLLAPDSKFLAVVFQVFGWALLGGLAGVGLSLFIPNLKWVYGLAGGAIGGAVGAGGYLVAREVAGDVVGRLVGGLILGFCIGLMVAIVEAAFRRAWLEVRYGARETITVNLGPEPVKVGGDSRACTVWARGAAPLALRYFIRNGQVICEDAPTRNEAVVANGDTREVGNVTVVVRTGTSAAPVAGTPARPSAPPRLPARAPSAPMPLPTEEPKPLDLDPLDFDPLPVSPPAPPPRPAPAAPPVAPPRPPVPVGGAKPPVPPPPAAPPRPTSPPPPAAKPAAGPRDPDACPSCGRKNPGRPGARYCMMCDQTY